MNDKFCKYKNFLKINEFSKKPKDNFNFYPNIFSLPCFLFFISPCHIKSHWNLIYRKINFPFTLFFVLATEKSKKVEMFSLCKSFNSFFILFLCLSLLLLIFFLMLLLLCYVVTFKKQYSWEEKKVVDKISFRCARESEECEICVCIKIILNYINEQWHFHILPIFFSYLWMECCEWELLHKYDFNLI